MMRIDTAHFGCLDVKAREVLCFPLGLPGLEHFRRWVLLTVPGESCVSWLQCVDDPKVALAVVEPRRFLPDYQVRACRRALGVLELRSSSEARVLVTVNRTPRGLTLNLKAPLVINMSRRMGQQVICNSDLPVQYPLEAAAAMRKIA